MAQPGKIFPVTTTDGVHFTGALAQNAMAFEAVLLPQAVGVGGRAECRILNATVWSTQNLDWEINVFDHKDPTSPDPNVDAFLGRWAFIAADGLQIGAAGLFRYYIDGLDILYADSLNAGKIYLGLVNRSATAKQTYALGAHFRLRMGCSPSLGW